ncbi:unspecific monooxygenase [Ancylostoma duodenale]|uniref:Unspecific monooxygenase n=1 Tax=Ancylostoma duodenale TaxID=51022 RepID=A0A0C2D5W2_9BILA|nr:unspecific monooxygenase [Ancylostoma duodenale]
MGIIEILLLIAILVFVLCYNINRILGLPPGPTPWPIVGNVLQLPMDDLDKRVLELRKQYGSVFTLWIPYPTVFIAEHEALKRTVVRDGDAYAGRPSVYLMQLLFGGNYGLSFEENDWYRSQRRFTLHTLRNLGVGKPIIKDTITMLSNRTVDLLRNTNGAAIELKPYLTNAVGNVISQLTFGFIRSPDDNELNRFQSLVAEVMEHFNEPMMQLLDVCPFLRHFDPIFGFGLKTTIHGNDAILEFIHKQLDDHKKAINYDQEPMNYVDAFLHEIHKREIEGIKDEFTEKQCVAAIYDLFVAGLETIVITLRFSFLFLLNYPEIQKRIHREIDDNKGTERDITMDDQKILPYTCAFLQEVYRVGYVANLNLLRVTLEDVNCEGYKLRKGTKVIPQFPCVHMDESIYPRPELLIPERHLKDGQFVRDEHVTGFSVGKRSCLGESLARMEVFMFFTSLMQKFRFEPEGPYPPEVKMQRSALRAPAPFKIRAIDRTIDSSLI